MSALESWDELSHTAGERTYPYYRKGSGPGVVVIHEVPGITPEVEAFADEVVEPALDRPRIGNESGEHVLQPGSERLGEAREIVGPERAQRDVPTLKVRDVAPGFVRGHSSSLGTACAAPTPTPCDPRSAVLARAACGR